MVHECDGGEREVSKNGWSARFFNKIGRCYAEDGRDLASGISSRDK